MKALVVIASAALLAATSIADAQASLTTKLTPTTLSEAVCLKAAAKAMESAGFRDIEQVGQSVFGYYRKYSIGLRCVEDLEVVFSAITGPDSKQATALLEKVTGLFENKDEEDKEEDQEEDRGRSKGKSRN